MKALVPIKRVADHNAPLNVKEDGSGIDLVNTRMSMNPFDEVAVEASLRLAENGRIGEIVVVSIGPEEARETLRSALGMGAHRAILVHADSSLEPFLVARILKALIDEEKPDLVITGKQAIDTDAAQTGPMLAGLLGWSQGCFVSAIALDADHVLVTREVNSGKQILTLGLPAVLTVDLSLNEPRYVSLPDILQARKKPLQERSATDFIPDLSPRLDVLDVQEFSVVRAGTRLDSAHELVARLRDDACIS